MKLLRRLAAFGLALLMSGCATATHSYSLSPTETEAVCAMANDLVWHPFGTVSWEDNPEEEARLLATADEAQFSKLPSRIQCSRNTIPLNDSDGIPFDSFWLSKDGTLAAISGGWLGGEMLGGGGICYFSKPDIKWVRQGCVATWAA